MIYIYRTQLVLPSGDSKLTKIYDFHMNPISAEIWGINFN